MLLQTALGYKLTGRLDDGTYHMISACKDGNPMLRSWIGDWIGTFLGELIRTETTTRS
jgi:hypothetical protein